MANFLQASGLISISVYVFLKFYVNACNSIMFWKSDLSAGAQ